jgi:hypothetical protein
MTYQCRIKFISHVDHGDIILGKTSKSLSQKTYEHEFTASADTGKILSLRNLRPGLDRGIELISFEIDGFNLPEPKEFTRFKMLDNPYVENKIIKEKELFFNGELEFEINEDRLCWFPTYYSKNKIDFVYQNNLATCTGAEGCWGGEDVEHTKEYFNVPFDPSISPKQGDNFALGCSQTYGTSMDKARTWPALMGYRNFGVPAGGIDSIYYNAHRIIELYKPGSMIIMFPTLTRRLIEFQKGDYFFRVPAHLNHLEEVFDRDYYWIKSDKLSQMLSAVIQEIVTDEENEYSKKFLQLISTLPCDISVSSWDQETYEILPNYFKKILPFFDRLDRASDSTHYGPKSHKNWVEKLKNHKI